MAKERIDEVKAKQLLREGMKPVEIVQKYDGFGKMQLAGYLAAMNRKKTHSREVTQEPESQVIYHNGDKPSITKERAIELLARGANPRKLANSFKGFEEGTLRAYKAHIDMDTYTANPTLLTDAKKPKNEKPAFIQTNGELVPFLKENPQALDLSLLALSLGADGIEIEETLLNLYGGKFKNREELHALLNESKDDLRKLLEEGVTGLGAYLGTYSLFDRRMAPMLLGVVTGGISIDQATPSLERMLLRVAGGIYDPLFNENTTQTMRDLTAKVRESKGLAQRIYRKLERTYENALETAEILKSFAKSR